MSDQTVTLFDLMNIPRVHCAYCQEPYVYPPEKCRSCPQYYCDSYRCAMKHLRDYHEYE